MYAKATKHLQTFSEDSDQQVDLSLDGCTGDLVGNAVPWLNYTFCVCYQQLCFMDIVQYTDMKW